MHAFGIWCGKAERKRKEKVANVLNAIITQPKDMGYKLDQDARALLAKVQADTFNRVEKLFGLAGSKRMHFCECSNNFQFGSWPPKKKFGKLSKRTNRRRIAEVAKHDDPAASDMRSSDFKSHSQPNIEEVISLLMETNLTKSQYLSICKFCTFKSCI